MSETASDDRDIERFYSDWEHSARHVLRVLYGFLALLLLAMWQLVAGNGEAFSLDVSLGLGFLMLVFWAITEANVRRLRANLPVLEVGPEGLVIPLCGPEPIPWNRVVKVTRLKRHMRYINQDHLRFEFAPGTLDRRQIGSFRKDRWDVLISVRTGAFGWQAARVDGSENAMIASVARYVPVSNRPDNCRSAAR